MEPFAEKFGDPRVAQMLKVAAESFFFFFYFYFFLEFSKAEFFFLIFSGVF